MSQLRVGSILALGLILAFSGTNMAQDPPRPDPTPGGEAGAERRNPRGGPGGGPMSGPKQKILKDFDADKNGRLNAEERTKARARLKEDRASSGRRAGGGPGMGPRRGGRGPGGDRAGETPKPGPKVDPESVAKHPQKPLFDRSVVRTVFLDFETEEWESELEDFYHTDVEVPAKLRIDDTMVEAVGVRFRGASSFFTVGNGSKRSLNISIDAFESKQRVLGAKTLNLLNSHTDPSFLHTVLFLEIARNFIPAPKANFVRLVINGHSWGLYISAQQFNNDFLKEHFGTKDGARWKVQGSPRGGAGLTDLGDDIEAYKKRYTAASDVSDDQWKALAKLCQTLSRTPVEGLPAAIEPMLDVEAALRFLALDVIFVNGDGYWTRASDFGIYLDPKGKFHFIPHDANETFQARGGFGPGGPTGGPPGLPPDAQGEGERPRPEGSPEDPPPGPGEGSPRRGQRGRPGEGGASGYELDPMVGMKDEGKPLRSKLLAVPEYRKRYLEIVGTLANEWLDWAKLEPVIAHYRNLIDPEIEADTRKLSSLAAFREAVSAESTPPEPGQRPTASLKTFLDRRRAFLLAYLAKKN